MSKRNALAQARQDRGVLIAAHRGMAAGNIPCNTIAAFEAALHQGADVLETDITVSGDGQLLIFHPKQEKNHLHQDIHLEQMTMEEIRQLRFVNIDNDVTPYGIATLDEFLETFKNRCLINLDHGWGCMPEMIRAVRHHGLEEQVLIKAPDKLKYAEIMEELAPDLLFMPIYKEKDTLTEQLEQMNINFAGAELVFARDDSPLVQDDYLKAHHDKGRMLWCNAILYSYKAQLSGGHTDDVAVMGDTENGWGWIIDKEFDIIQTDWVMPLRQFINNR